MSDTGSRPAAEDRLAHLRDSELAAFLEGGLTDRERGRVEAHIDICDSCRAELIDVGRVAGGRGAFGRRAKLTARWWWIPAAAAAGIVTILLVPRPTSHSRADGDRTRATRVADSEGRRRIELVSPQDDVTVTGAQVIFTWHAVPADVYRLSLLTASGDSIWATQTTDTSVALPETPNLRSGDAYFWRVEAVANGIVATGVHRVHISR